MPAKLPKGKNSMGLPVRGPAMTPSTKVPKTAAGKPGTGVAGTPKTRIPGLGHVSKTKMP